MKISTTLFIIVALLSTISPDKLSFLYAGCILIWLVPLTWRTHEPKILLIGLSMYWLSTSLLLVYGLIGNKPISSLSIEAPTTITYTNFLANTALVFYTLGMVWQVKKVKVISLDKLKMLLMKYDEKNLLLVYIIYSFFTVFLNRIFLQLSGGQLLNGFIQLKWSFLTLLIIHSILTKKNQNLVLLFTSLELISSLSGFWASFKDFIFISAAAALTPLYKLKLRSFLALTLVGLLVLAWSVIWTFSKEEYRNYLTGGVRSQQVVQNNNWKNLQMLSQIINKNLSKKNYKKNIETGFFSLVNRVSYIEYFAMTVRRVPNEIPHEYGQLLQEALSHVLRPRFLFPEKKIIDDSELTSKYTGRLFSGLAQGSSFSLGLVAEQYIDFGPIFMFIPIFFLGAWIGAIYRIIITKSHNLVWGVSLIAPLVFFIPSLGTPTTKFLGWTIYYILTFYFVNYFILPFLDRILLKKRL